MWTTYAISKWVWDKLRLPASCQYRVAPSRGTLSFRAKQTFRSICVDNVVESVMSGRAKRSKAYYV